MMFVSLPMIQRYGLFYGLKWIYQNHGLRTEPSGAIAAAALLGGDVPLLGTGDIVVVVSGRNVDELRFQEWIATA